MEYSSFPQRSSIIGAIPSDYLVSYAGLTPLQRCSRFILQRKPTGPHDTGWGSYTPLQRSSQCILQPSSTFYFIFIYAIFLVSTFTKVVLVAFSEIRLLLDDALSAFYIQIWNYTHTRTHTHTHGHIHTYTQIHTHAHTHAQIHKHTFAKNHTIKRIRNERFASIILRPSSGVLCLSW